jgi:hypothetical protein
VRVCLEGVVDDVVVIIVIVVGVAIARQELMILSSPYIGPTESS